MRLQANAPAASPSPRPAGHSQRLSSRAPTCADELALRLCKAPIVLQVHCVRQVHRGDALARRSLAGWRRAVQLGARQRVRGAQAAPQP